MKSEVEKLNPTRVKITVEVSAEELKPHLDKAFASIASQIQVPGFRKGKVPARIIEQRVGRGPVVDEAVNALVPQLLSDAMAEHQVQGLGQPELDVQALPLNEGDPLKLTFEMDARPDIAVPEYDGMEVVVDTREITDEQVDEALQGLRSRFGTLNSVERAAAEGDVVTLDLKGEIDSEVIDEVSGITYEVGTDTLLDGTDDAVRGLSVGESGTFVAPMKAGEHVGKDATITVTVTAVKERILPDLDDEFAQLASEFDTFDELRANTRTQVEREALVSQGIEAREKAVDALLAMADIPVPEAIVAAEVDRHLEGEGREQDDEHRAEVTETTENGMRTQFLLDAVVAQREITVEQGDIIEYLVMTAQQYGMQPAQFMQLLEQQDAIPGVISEVGRRKAVAHILDSIRIVDTAGNPVALSSLDDAELEAVATVTDEADELEHDHQH